MRYALTGNFQYDIGVYGLKKVLDFFEEDYKTDNAYYLEVDKTEQELLELLLLYLSNIWGVDYFYKKALEKVLGGKVKEKGENKEIEIDQRKYEEFIKKEKSLDKAVEYLTDYVIERYKKQGGDSEKVNRNREDLRDYLYTVVVRILNTVLHNFQSDNNKTGKAFLIGAVEKLNKCDEGKEDCSFCCGMHKGIGIRRDYFFFAPARRNAFWFNEPDIFICKYCVIAELAILSAIKFYSNSRRQGFFVYVPNLKEMEDINNLIFRGKEIKDVNELLFKFVEDVDESKIGIERSFVISVLLDGEKPEIELLSFNKEGVERVRRLKGIKTGDENKIKWFINRNKKNDKDNTIAFVSQSKGGYKEIYLGKEFLLTLLSGRDLYIDFVSKYLPFVIKSVNDEIKAKKGNNNSLFKNFRPEFFLDVLDIKYTLEERMIMDYKEVKEFGEKLKSAIKKSSSNNNVANNKMVSVANALINSSNAGYSDFLNTLTRIMITYDIRLRKDVYQSIDKSNYKEVASIIALALFSYNDKNANANNNVNNEESKEV